MTAESLLRRLQDAVDARDLAALEALFDGGAVLIGPGGDARTPDALHAYLTAVVTQEESLRWEWHEIVPFHEASDTLGFAAFGDIVVSAANGERRAPIRLTVLAAQSGDSWKLRQFHGSIAAGF